MQEDSASETHNYLLADTGSHHSRPESQASTGKISLNVNFLVWCDAVARVMVPDIWNEC
jgi:hypothetical protein